MTELIHGGDIYGHEKELLDFSANLSPLEGGEGSARVDSLRQWRGRSHFPDGAGGEAPTGCCNSAGFRGVRARFARRRL